LQLRNSLFLLSKTFINSAFLALIMIFEEDKKVEKIGSILGYIFSYFLFTTILYLILLSLKSWNVSYISVIVITIVITLIGIVIKNLLK